MTAAPITLEGVVAIRGGTGHVHAARRLREAFGGIDWRDGGDGPAVELREDPVLAEGAFRIKVGPGRVTVEGGPFSGVIYGIEELITRAGDDTRRMQLPEGDIEDAPGLA